MTRIALLQRDVADRASLAASLASALGEVVNVVDDTSQAEGQLIIGAVSQEGVVAALEGGCADFVTVPFAAEEVARVVASLRDAEICEEAVALLGEAGRTTIAELGRATSNRLVVLGEKGTGAVAFARFWAGRDRRPVRVVDASSLDAVPNDHAVVVLGIERLDQAARRTVWASANARAQSTQVAIVAIGEILDPVDQWPRVMAPPLRDRIIDVARIVHHFERLFATRRGHDVVVPMRSLSAMQSYRFPNQLPELRATVDSLGSPDLAPASRGASAEYRVPVQSEEVALHLVGGATKTGRMFWPSEFEFAEALETGDPFFPLNLDGKIEIIARVSVEAFGIPQTRDSLSWEQEVLAKRVRARLFMQSGAHYEGEFVYSADQSRARVADYLNGKSRYFVFRIGRELLHVSKAHLVSVEELR